MLPKANVFNPIMIMNHDEIIVFKVSEIDENLGFNYMAFIFELSIFTAAKKLSGESEHKNNI